MHSIQVVKKIVVLFSLNHDVFTSNTPKKMSEFASDTSSTLFFHSFARSSSAGLLASGGSWEDLSTKTEIG
jgi:hypothetical protein